MTTEGSFDVNSPPTTWAILLLAAFAPASAVLSPLIVGAYVTDLEFSAQQAGYLIAAELIGAALSTFSTLYLVGRANWHKILHISIAIIVVGYLISSAITSFEILLPIRFTSGLALGTVMTMTIVVCGMTKDPERAFGFWSLGQIIFAVVGFAVFPHLFPVIGVKGFFLVMAAIMSVILLPVRFMPTAGTERHKQGLKSVSPKAKKMAPIGLLAVLFYYTAIGSVWAYVERIANAANLPPEFIGYTLSAASIVGVMGAGAATWLSTRFGRLLPVIFGYAVIGLGILLIFGLQSATLYAISSLLFKFGWWFAAPYLLANMTGLDPSGRIAILTNFFIACGMGLGPAAAAAILSLTQGENGQLNFNPVVLFGVVCLTISLPLLYIIIRVNAAEQDQA